LLKEFVKAVFHLDRKGHGFVAPAVGLALQQEISLQVEQKGVQLLATKPAVEILATRLQTSTR